MEKEKQKKETERLFVERIGSVHFPRNLIPPWIQPNKQEQQPRNPQKPSKRGQNNNRGN